MFAGIGGFRSGLSHYGDFFVPVGYCEIDPYAKRAYEAIYEPKGEIYFEDARGIIPENLPDIDLICGGFPCQSFSIAGKRGGFEDARGTLFFEIARIARVKRPHFLLLENVPGLLSHDGAGRLRPSSVRWMNWGIMSHGRCLTAQISEFPNSAKECCLSDILEKNPEAKYYLSRKQTQKLLSKGLAGVRVIGFTPETD